MSKRISKRMIIMLTVVGILFGGIFGYQAFVGYMTKQYFATMKERAVAVSSTSAAYTEWQPELKASGSLRAVRGVNVTTEVAGLVQKIYFANGATVKEGDTLVQLSANTDLAKLRSLEAAADLAKVTYQRDKAQYAIKAISKATLDTDAADLKSKQAEVEQQASLVAKKTIKAPFSGRLGITTINPGQYLQPGDKIVDLQSLDPIYVDFAVPQQALTRLKTDLPATISTDTFPGKTFTGKINAIDPGIDPATRNVEVEATIANPDHELAPGMFASVVVNTGEPQRYITLPQTAVSFNPYGDVVFVITNKNVDKDSKDKPGLTVTQRFVTTGETRGDQIAILSGLKEGEQVVTSGQLKLKNGSPVIINNSVTPANSPAPKIANE